MSPPPFKIHILGAGIAGLATAIPLARAGHHVTISESKPSISELGAGLQVFPNAMRIIYAWGLEEALRPLANEAEVMSVRRFEDGRVLGEIPQNPTMEWEFGFPSCQVYRPDLQRILHKAAVEAGVVMGFGKKAVQVDVEAGIVEFADERKVDDADLIVGADGILSSFRELLPGNAGIKAVSASEFCFRTTVDKAAMLDDPETAALMDSREWMVWCGPGAVVLGYPVNGGSKYNTLISVSHDSDASMSHWSEAGDLQEARDLVKDFAPAVRKVWNSVSETV